MKPPKKLKPGQTRIALDDGRELHYYVPAERPNAQRLSDHLPAQTPSRFEVEIGCGKGEFIARRAAAYPDTFFVGIDRREDRFDLTQRKLNRQATEANWVVIREDARTFLEEPLPPIDVLHVYHPDPWPKTRHHKHRFFRSPDARAWAEAVKSGGELRLSTDHRDYFEEILDIVRSWKLFDWQFSVAKTHHMGEPVTHFEGIFLKKGEPAYKAYFRRR